MGADVRQSQSRVQSARLLQIVAGLGAAAIQVGVRSSQGVMQRMEKQWATLAGITASPMRTVTRLLMP